MIFMVFLNNSVIDKTDESLMSGALRETQEELGIDPAQIEVLGEIGPPETTLLGDMTVWPFVASPLTDL
jgi:nudix motif 8